MSWGGGPGTSALVPGSSSVFNRLSLKYAAAQPMDLVTGHGRPLVSPHKDGALVITLTRLGGSVFALNSDLIERVDSTPDTVITLVDGTKYVVCEGLRAVVDAIREYRGAVIAESARMTSRDEALAASTPIRRLASVPDDLGALADLKDL
jgi:flagellar protein FlbD